MRVVYFVARMSDGAIKIGTTNDMPRRLFELQRECECELMATERGGFDHESGLHDRFRKSRMYADNHLTEWFAPTDELAQYICSIERAHDAPAASSPYDSEREEAESGGVEGLPF